jgi:hypothetical protein
MTDQNELIEKNRGGNAIGNGSSQQEDVLPLLFYLLLL